MPGQPTARLLPKAGMGDKEPDIRADLGPAFFLPVSPALCPYIILLS